MGAEDEHEMETQTVPLEPSADAVKKVNHPWRFFSVVAFASIMAVWAAFVPGAPLSDLHPLLGLSLIAITVGGAGLAFNP